MESVRSFEIRSLFLFVIFVLAAMTLLSNDYMFLYSFDGWHRSKCGDQKYGYMYGNW
jgi:hypothetical protein